MRKGYRILFSWKFSFFILLRNTFHSDHCYVDEKHQWILSTSPRFLTARQQSDSNAYLPPFSTQRPPEKPRPFQSPGVTSFPVQRPSSLYTPPNTGSYPGSVQPLYSTPRPSLPSSQQPSSTYVPQGFSGSTSYNPRPSQPSYSNAGSSAFPPLSSPESSSTYLPPQPPSIPTTSARPSLPESTIGGNGFSGNGYQSSIGIDITAGGYSPGGSAGTLQPPVTGGYSTPGGFSTSYGYPSERPSPSFPTPGEGGGYPSPSGPTTTGYPPSTPRGPPFISDQVGIVTTTVGVDITRGPGTPGETTECMFSSLEL